MINDKSLTNSHVKSQSKEEKEGYVFFVESTTPLANVYGEDSTIQLDDGAVVFVYPPSIKYSISSNDVTEIRMKEDKVFNKETNQTTFTPVEVSFVFLKDGIETEIFWVNVQDLISNDRNKSFAWTNTILQKKYKGKQYKQILCK